MKTRILLIGFILMSGLAFSATVTITNSGFTFSPDNVTINAGDTVIFQLAGSHNAVEVSQATWNANGDTPLPGFSVGFGGGQVTGLSAGVHYYVCQPHASLGMKGRITVNAVSGIGDNESGDRVFGLSPNPTTGKFIFELKENGPFSDFTVGTQQPVNLEVFDILGTRVFQSRDIASLKRLEINISSFPDGIYFVRINEGKTTYTRKLIKN